MKKSKIELLFKVILLILILLRICTISTIKSKIDINETIFIGTLTNIKFNGDKVTIELLSKEKLVVSYYITEQELQKFNKFKLGDTLKVVGKLKIANKNTNFNLFNYKNYLLSKNIFYICEASEIEVIKNNTNLFYKIKNNLNSYVDKFKSKEYIFSLVMGKNTLDEEIYETYQNNGVSHLFAVSGMHVTILSSLLLYILGFVIKNKKATNIIIMLFLLFYCFIANFTPSILRAVLLFIIINITKMFNLKINTMKILALILIILLLYNPFNIYNIGFLFSFLISFSLIIFSKNINKYKNYFFKLFITSLISFMVSIPLLINNFFEINLLTPLINLLFVPLISIIIFPLSLITLIMPFMDNVLYFLLQIMEFISTCINKVDFLKIILCNVNISIICIYYILIFVSIVFLFKKKFQFILLFLVILLLHSNIKIFNNYPLITILDQTTPNMIQRISGIFQRNPLISMGI